VTRLPLKPQRGKTTFLTGGPGEMTFITEQQGEPEVYTAVPRVISSDYFGAMGIPILAGRAFDEKDIAESPGVAIISHSMAARSWPGEDPVGKRLIMGVRTNPWLIVVGVAGDVRHSLDVDPRPQVYLPYTQTTFFNPQDLVIRAEVNPLSLVESVRKEIWAMDEDLPITGIGTMSHIMLESIARQRFNLLLMGIFAALSLLLAAGGLFGVTSYLVAQSTREIGIRMALGAQGRDVMKIVIAQGMTLTSIGMALGLLAAFMLTRMLSGMLYGVSATDPLTLAAVAAVLGLVSLLACYAPARRATKVDPMIALRYE
ncbi:MAG TPA: FtsX-like permease family protein, partial [Blastocatellia bacterium]|nr:FtsX-like permease family protein [Blastocatellia bacterium]